MSPWLVPAAFAAGLAVGGGTVWVAKRDRPAADPNAPAAGAPAGAAPGLPSPDREGQDWTHADLAGYLRGRGMTLALDPKLAYGGRPTTAFEDRSRADDGPPGRLPPLSPRADVILCRDDRDAREVAGLGDGGFAWGRFAVWAPQPLAAEIRGHLVGPARPNRAP